MKRSFSQFLSKIKIAGSISTSDWATSTCKNRNSIKAFQFWPELSAKIKKVLWHGWDSAKLIISLIITNNLIFSFIYLLRNLLLFCIFFVTFLTLMFFPSFHSILSETTLVSSNSFEIKYVFSKWVFVKNSFCSNSKINLKD